MNITADQARQHVEALKALALPQTGIDNSIVDSLNNAANFIESLVPLFTPPADLAKLQDKHRKAMAVFVATKRSFPNAKQTTILVEYQNIMLENFPSLLTELTSARERIARLEKDRYIDHNNNFEGHECFCPECITHRTKESNQ